tara:strand:+ start:1240 stop:1491 length:252 start_codon:yes stop_codon:yes gene_type:complete
MSLTKKRIQDKIEIVGEFKHIQLRYQDQIIENDVVISESYYRDTVICGDLEKAKEHNVEKIAEVVWASDIVKEYKKSIKPIEE